MGFYPDKVRDALRNTAGDATCANVTGRGTAASFECGCSVTVEVSVAVDQPVLDDLSFTSNGCGYMIAAARSLDSLLKGADLREANGTDETALSRHIAASLGGLPTERVHCALVAIEALQAALADHRQQRIDEFRGECALVCTCFGVSEDTIDRVIDNNEATTVEDVTRICRAGAGCGSCRMIIAEMIDNRGK